MTSAIPAGKIETINSMQLYYEVHGRGEPVLMLHGFTGSSQDWSALPPEWRSNFRLIIPDMRGHGRSSSPSKTFRHDEAATHMFALLDHLGITTFKGVGVSGGGNVLLHLATRQPDRVKAMVLVSATSYFPIQARPIMRQYTDTIPKQTRAMMRRQHPGGDAQVQALLASAKAFADSYDDMNFTPPYLTTITARTQRG